MSTRKENIFVVDFSTAATKKIAFKPGDKVYVKAGKEKSYDHRGRVGTVREVSDHPAHSVSFDDDPNRVHQWYVGDELVQINKDAPDSENEACEAAKKKFGGKKRSDLDDSDFLYPTTRSFPIMSTKDVEDAIHDYGRSGSGDSYEVFIKKLWQKAKSKGLEAGIPQSTRDKYNLK